MGLSTDTKLECLAHGGNANADVVIILEPGNNYFTTPDHKSLLTEMLSQCGIDPREVAIIRCAPKVPEHMLDNKTQTKNYIQEYRDMMLQALSNYDPKVILSTGSHVLTQMMNKTPFKVSEYTAKVKKVFLDKERNVVSISSLDNAIHRLDTIPTLQAEITALKKFKEQNYEYSEKMFVHSAQGYYWSMDLSEVVDNKPSAIAFDTETTGLDWKRRSVFPITGQLTHTKGQAILTPLSDKYFPEYFKEKIESILTFINNLCGNKEKIKLDYKKFIKKIITQWKDILEDENVKVMGQDLKFDMHMISKVGIEVNNVFFDTLQALHAIDENAKRRNLDIAVKKYVKDLYGYADFFNETTDKSNMIGVHPDDMISYAGGDTDATFRLARELFIECRKDETNFDVLMKVRMPAIKSLYNLEKTGIRVDLSKLPELSKLVDKDLKERRLELISKIPRPLLRKHTWKKSDISGKADVLMPNNADLLIDAMFSEQGLNLTPIIKSSTTGKPSLSVKDHLSFFFETGHELLFLYDDYTKISKLSSTYIGNDNNDDDLKGLYKYVYTNPKTQETRVHTSFNINTTTGRTSSKNPNVQNLPQGRARDGSTAPLVAKAYKDLFIPREGYTMVEIDYSQAEVRLVAQASQDKRLLEIYRKGLDVYKFVAATVIMKISVEEFEQLPKSVQKAKRQAAKAVVLGFLYGMYPTKFKTYAKTTFNVDFSDEEAKQVREDFFEYFHGVAKWHEDQKQKVNSQEWVKALHGATRHLPGIRSKDKWVRMSNERDAVNNPIQGCASDMGLIALNCIYKDFDLDIIRPINFVHDAIYFEVKNEYLEEYCPYLKWYMENIPLKEMFGLELDLPLVAEVECGSSFAQKEEIEYESVRPEFCTL